MMYSAYDQDALLKQALIDYYADEYERYDNLTSDMPDHLFSPEFEYRIKAISRASERRYVSISRHRLRRAAVITAAITIILASTIVTLAIVRPQIFFRITERATNWMIEFRQEGGEERAPEFSCIKPKTPAGYTITHQELIDDFEYSVEYSSGTDSFIRYSQSISDGTITYLDADDISIEHKNLMGHEIVVAEDEQISSIFFEDGNYIFYIDGNCDVEQLISMARDVLDQ